jgi:hypothetical protein
MGHLSHGYVSHNQRVEGFPVEFPFVHFCTKQKKVCRPHRPPHPLDQTWRAEFMLTKKGVFTHTRMPWS